MRLKKSQFKKLIAVICIFIGISVIVCVGNFFLIPYLSAQTELCDDSLAETDSYGGFKKLESDFTELNDKIKSLNEVCAELDTRISELNTQKAQTEALYNEALINNEMLKNSGSSKYEELKDKYTEAESQYKELLDKYNKLKED